MKTNIHTLLIIMLLPFAATINSYADEPLKPENLKVSNSEAMDSITQRFRRQLQIFPQEKVYLHTDEAGIRRVIPSGCGHTWWMQPHTELPRSADMSMWS